MKNLKIIIPLIAVLAFSGIAFATKDNQEKVTICHRTDSVTNPYEKISVDKDGLNGHGDHTGPLATSQEKAQELKDAKTKWGDIIPGVLNDTDAGKAILANDCKVPEKEPVPPVTPGTSDNNTSTNVPGGQGAGQPTILPATGATY